MNNNNFIDETKNIVYEKELQIEYFTKNPDATYNDFLDVLILFVKKGYTVKDRKNNMQYPENIETMLYSKKFPWRKKKDNETSNAI